MAGETDAEELRAPPPPSRVRTTAERLLKISVLVMVVVVEMMVVQLNETVELLKKLNQKEEGRLEEQTRRFEANQQKNTRAKNTCFGSEHRLLTSSMPDNR